MTRRLRTVSILAAILLVVACPEARAQGASDQKKEEPELRIGFLTLGSEIAMTTAYVWRGFVSCDQTCVQPEVSAKAGPLTFTSWMSAGRTDGSSLHLKEHDFIVDYSHEFRSLVLSAGWNNYSLFEGTNVYSNEFYVGAQRPGPLNPAVQIYHDVQQGDGTYISVSVGQEWPIWGERISGSTEVKLGYNDHQWVETTGFSDLHVAVGLTIVLPSSRVELQPSMKYSRSLQRGVFPDKLYGGLAVVFK